MYSEIGEFVKFKKIAYLFSVDEEHQCKSSLANENNTLMKNYAQPKHVSSLTLDVYFVEDLYYLV